MAVDDPLACLALVMGATVGEDVTVAIPERHLIDAPLSDAYVEAYRDLARGTVNVTLRRKRPTIPGEVVRPLPAGGNA